MEAGDQLHAARFTPEESASDVNLIGGWLGPRASLDASQKRKISCLWRELTYESSVQHK
jgi:hypothetical protein